MGIVEVRHVQVFGISLVRPPQLLTVGTESLFPVGPVSLGKSSLSLLPPRLLNVAGIKQTPLRRVPLAIHDHGTSMGLHIFRRVHAIFA